MAKAPGSRGTKATGSKTTKASAGPKTTKAAAGSRAMASRAAAASKTPAAAKAAPARATGKAKAPEQHRTGWSKDDIKELKALVKSNTPTPLMAYKLQRTVHATRAKARELGISLKPVNRSPYGRVK